MNCCALCGSSNVSVEKQYYKMPELVGFQTMEILDPNGVTFDAVGVFGLDF